MERPLFVTGFGAFEGVEENPSGALARGLAAHGQELSHMHASDLMTREVKTCALEDDIKLVMSRMTHGRIRHLPVVDGGKLCGIISIGDVVKNRLEELEMETSVLRDYAVARG